VILPNDLQELEYEDPPLAHGATHTGIGYAGPAKLPEESLLRSAADVLNSGKKIAMLVGAGALEATDEVIAIAERLQAGVAKALLGKARIRHLFGGTMPRLSGGPRRILQHGGKITTVSRNDGEVNRVAALAMKRGKRCGFRVFGSA
jgi:hypothetical protein